MLFRSLDGEKMARLCEEFGISRKTGYKIFERYKDIGVPGLVDRSRRPFRHANALPMVIEKSIVRLKREYPSWGAPKIRERLKRRWPEVQCPAISTVHAVLDRHGLVRRRRRRTRPPIAGTPLSQPVGANRLWCADYKGEFMLANRHYCYPLPITDFASRYLIACEALSTTKERYAFAVFERADHAPHGFLGVVLHMAHVPVHGLQAELMDDACKLGHAFLVGGDHCAQISEVLFDVA